MSEYQEAGLTILSHRVHTMMHELLQLEYLARYQIVGAGRPIAESPLWHDLAVARAALMQVKQQTEKIQADLRARAGGTTPVLGAAGAAQCLQVMAEQSAWIDRVMALPLPQYLAAKQQLTPDEELVYHFFNESHRCAAGKYKAFLEETPPFVQQMELCIQELHNGAEATRTAPIPLRVLQALFGPPLQPVDLEQPGMRVRLIVERVSEIRDVQRRDLGLIFGRSPVADIVALHKTPAAPNDDAQLYVERGQHAIEQTEPEPEPETAVVNQVEENTTGPAANEEARRVQFREWF